MRNNKLIAAAMTIAAALFFTGCFRSGEINLVSKNFEAEVEQQQNLIFTFDKDLVPDSLTGTWDTLPYIHFTPDVKGKFKWNGTKELLFSPLSGFSASTEYKAEFKKILGVRSRQRFGAVSPQAVSFHTPYLNLAEANGYWTVSKKNPGQAALMISLLFNYRMDPGTVQSMLKLSRNGQASAFEIASTSVDKKITVVLDGISKEEVTQIPVHIDLSKGLKSTESAYETKEPQSMDVIIPSPAKLEVSTVTGEFMGTDAVIHVYTTQAVDDNKLESMLVLDPKIDVETETTENGFLVKGAFNAGQAYSLVIKKEIRGVLGRGLDNDYKAQVSFGQMEPSIAFLNQKGIYLSSKSSKNVAVNIVNIPKVHVTVYRIFENNISHYFRNGRNHEYWYDDEGEYSEGGFNYNTHDMQYFGKPVFERDYDTKDMARLRGMNLLNLSFDDDLPFKGIYLVKVSSTSDAWRNATKLVSVSDIGMITKKSEDELYVFANSIKSAEPLKDIKVSLISRNNQNVLSAVTNSEGVAVFTNLRQRLNDFNVDMITARDAGDFNYLVFNDTKVNASRFDVGGRRANATGLMAFIYGDRDIYRPGETIHLNSVIRTEQWQMQADLPVKLKILLPNGKEYKNIRATLNRQGAFTTSVDLPVSAVTGNYIAQLFTSNDVLIESKNISVEEFMPDRIDVKLRLSKESMGSGDTMKVSLTALNMFGPPAADRKYELTYNINRKSFTSKDFPGYYFDMHNESQTRYSPDDVIEGKTDENGIAEHVFSSNEEWKDQGVLGGKVFATVFDETGRPVNRVRSFDIYTQDIFYGMKVTDRYVDRGVQLVIPMIAVDKKGKAMTTKAQVQVVRYDWYSAVEQDSYGGRYRYISKKREVILLDQVVSFPSTGYAFSYIPRESGEYEVRISDPESERYVAQEFYSWGWGYTSNTSFEVNTEGHVEIKPDKEKYKPGEEATLVFTTPFNGRLLVTLECDKVIEYRYIQTDKKSAMMKLPVKETYMPNIYVTATLFRPLDDGSIPLTVGHGILPIQVEKNGTRLPVTIKAPEKSRSKTKQLITVKTNPQENIEMTIAVVDEGILALKNYQTPDPHGFFYQKKALNVNAYDLYPYLLPDLQWNRSSTGGDGYDLEKRVNPLTNKRVKLVALWSGILHTNANGEASYVVEIPQFSGDLRIMACAYKGKSFGSADKHIKVADPVVISAGIPRFLSPRDTLTMPVTLTNTTSKPAEATARLALEGGLKIAGPESQTVTLKANGEQRVNFKVVAGDAMGNGSITVSVNSMNEKFTDKTDITIRPATSLLKISGSGEITKSKSIDLKHDFIPATASARLVLSSNPMAQFSKALGYLVGYPYGCIEQTTSKAFPQIYFSELAKNMKYGFSTDLNPATNVQAAVNKLQGMQQYDGGMSYWPGSSETTWWGTTYATHFLIEAEKAGYDVNKGVIERSLNYMAQKVKGRITDDYYYDWDFNSWKKKRIYAKENFYSLYLMALYSKADISSMNYYKADLSMVALDCRYMLACTYLAVGDRKSYGELLPKSFEGERSRNAFGGSFYSYLRDMAISLNVLLETDPDNPQIPELVSHLSRQLNAKEWINTQEAAYSFLALGKFMKKINTGEKVTATVVSNGNQLASFDGKDITIKKGIAGQSLQVNVNGNGRLFYFWEIEGISAKGETKEEDNYLMVRKSYFDRFGRGVDLNKVEQGDLIVVKASLTNLEKSKIENIVVTDMLPAGFEIENPRLSDKEEMEWIKDQSQPDYFDVRDDRINFFTDIDSKPRHFYYMVRAVSTGNYRMGPISADAMYNGEYHSYYGAGTVRITN